MLGKILGTHWELERNIVRTHWEARKNEKKQGTLSACLGLPIGCMKFLFPKDFIANFGMGQRPLQRTPHLFSVGAHLVFKNN
jgi:hypothetical protein